MEIKFIEYAVIVVFALLPIANPFSTAPSFIGLTQGYSTSEKVLLAKKACIYMALILLVFLIAGSLLMTFFGITINSLRVAGGLIILFIGFRMLFPEKEQVVSVDQTSNSNNADDIALVPIALPMLSGPGAISVVIGMSAEISAREAGFERVIGYCIVGVGIILTSLICFIVLRMSTRVVDYFGENGISAFTRIMGFFLICIGVEFLLGGMEGVVLRLTSISEIKT